jgi:hypothetical protein
MKIKLSSDLKEKVKSGTVKTHEVISFILSNVTGTTTNKPVFETSLSDISFNGKHAKKGMFDTFEGILYLEF